MSGVKDYVVGRYGMTFAVLALVGLLLWTLSTPAVAVLFLGEPGYEAAYGSPIYGFLGLPLLALLPLVAGFALRQGILHVGLGSGIGACAGAVWLAARTDPEVTFGTPDPGTVQILGLAFVELMVFLFLALACTAAAGLSRRGPARPIPVERGRLRENLLGAGQH